jgi:hypothetical protein
VLDLSALQLLGSVDGWYNITDMHQQLRGQIKVCGCGAVRGRLAAGGARGMKAVREVREMGTVRGVCVVRKLRKMRGLRGWWAVKRMLP